MMSSVKNLFRDMGILVFLGCSLLLTESVFAQNSSGEIDSLVNPILTSIRKGETANLATLAFAKGKARNYIPKDAISSLDENFETVLRDIGKFHSSSLLIESEIENIYISRLYVLKCDREPLLLRIGFYKPSDSWQVQNITIGDPIADIVKEASEVAVGALSTGTKNGLFSKEVLKTHYSGSASN